MPSFFDKDEDESRPPCVSQTGFMIRISIIDRVFALVLVLVDSGLANPWAETDTDCCLEGVRVFGF